ncbi:hypothetical protein [Brucella pseudogrignonensis]|uniref:Uncharacterized protein n=1 Tax=Ochrobactrum phage POA1180 TaxID=1897640 RepID=A0A219VH99_9CAUD|nr:hypothetical protein [Brucella pseudogrignonensis]YP_010665094.1 hypothetical protein PQB33_gp11 [Ochrobactrum phage POA1180]AOT25319.1 hypothetical protein POA1180_11 [Ochrobactrum phage POA1180]KAB2692007.1 hypothetical protein F9K82_08855 [Brucella pseudogrignonensis]
MSKRQSRINEFRAAVVETIRKALPELRECESQFGRFNLDELETTSVKAPAVRVGLLQGKLKHTASGQAEGTMSCAAFVVTDGKDRDDMAWVIAEAVAVSLHTSQMFGLFKLGTPQAVSIQPVISAAIKSRGVSIIAVEWTQELQQLGQNIFDQNGIVPSELYINGELVEVRP